MALIKLTGKASWAKLSENNRDFYDEKDLYGSYKLDLEITESEAKEWELERVKVHRNRETGLPFLRLSRPHQIDYEDKETKEKKTWELGPPSVVNENLEPFTGLIGNGSPVIVQVEQRPYGTGKVKKQSLRLIAVQVDTRTMVVYEGGKLQKLDKPLGEVDLTDSPF